MPSMISKPIIKNLLKIETPFAPRELMGLAHTLLGLPLGLVNTKPIENRPKIYDLVNRILVIEIEKTETEKYRKSWFGFW